MSWYWGLNDLSNAISGIAEDATQRRLYAAQTEFNTRLTQRLTDLDREGIASSDEYFQKGQDIIHETVSEAEGKLPWLYRKKLSQNFLKPAGEAYLGLQNRHYKAKAIKAGEQYQGDLNERLLAFDQSLGQKNEGDGSDGFVTNLLKRAQIDAAEYQIAEGVAGAIDEFKAEAIKRVEAAGANPEEAFAGLQDLAQEYIDANTENLTSDTFKLLYEEIGKARGEAESVLRSVARQAPGQYGVLAENYLQDGDLRTLLTETQQIDPQHVEGDQLLAMQDAGQIQVAEVAARALEVQQQRDFQHAKGVMQSEFLPSVTELMQEQLENTPVDNENAWKREGFQPIEAAFREFAAGFDQSTQEQLQPLIDAQMGSMREGFMGQVRQKRTQRQLDVTEATVNSIIGQVGEGVESRENGLERAYTFIDGMDLSEQAKVGLKEGIKPQLAIAHAQRMRKEQRLHGVNMAYAEMPGGLGGDGATGTQVAFLDMLKDDDGDYNLDEGRIAEVLPDVHPDNPVWNSSQLGWDQLAYGVAQRQYFEETGRELDIDLATPANFHHIYTVFGDEMDLGVEGMSEQAAFMENLYTGEPNPTHIREQAIGWGAPPQQVDAALQGADAWADDQIRQREQQHNDRLNAQYEQAAAAVMSGDMQPEQIEEMRLPRQQKDALQARWARLNTDEDSPILRAKTVQEILTDPSRAFDPTSAAHRDGLNTIVEQQGIIEGIQAQDPHALNQAMELAELAGMIPENVGHTMATMWINPANTQFLVNAANMAPSLRDQLPNERIKGGLLTAKTYQQAMMPPEVIAQTINTNRAEGTAQVAKQQAIGSYFEGFEPEHAANMLIDSMGIWWNSSYVPDPVIQQQMLGDFRQLFDAMYTPMGGRPEDVEAAVLEHMRDMYDTFDPGQTGDSTLKKYPPSKVFPDLDPYKFDSYVREQLNLDGLATYRVESMNDSQYTKTWYIMSPEGQNYGPVQLSKNLDIFNGEI